MNGFKYVILTKRREGQVGTECALTTIWAARNHPSHSSPFFFPRRSFCLSSHFAHQTQKRLKITTSWYLLWIIAFFPLFLPIICFPSHHLLSTSLCSPSVFSSVLLTLSKPLLSLCVCVCNVIAEAYSPLPDERRWAAATVAKRDFRGSRLSLAGSMKRGYERVGGMPSRRASLHYVYTCLFLSISACPPFSYKNLPLEI